MTRPVEFIIPDVRQNVIRTSLERAFAANSIIVSLGVFSFVFSVKFGLSDNIAQLFADGVLNTADLVAKLGDIVNRRLHEVLLFVGTIFWFLVYRSASYSEIALLSQLHSKARLPDRFEDFASLSTVVALSVGLTVCFALMAFFVNYFPLFCLFLFAASLQDIFGNRTIITQLRLLQKQRNADIPDTDPRRDFIVRLREECYEYWTYKPQIERIILFFLLNTLALFIYLFVAGIAYRNLTAPEPKAVIESYMWFILRLRNPEEIMNPDVAGYDLWIVCAYAVSFGAILWNEYTIGRWRRARNDRLRAIFDEEFEVEQQRARGEVAAD